MVNEVWSPGAIGSLNLEVRGPNWGERRTCLSDDRMKVYQNTLAQLRLPHVCEGGPCSTDIRVCNT